MKHLINLIILIPFLFSCQEKMDGIRVKFSVDMSDELSNISDPATIGVAGNIKPLNWREITYLNHEGNGVYSIEVVFPSDVLGDTLGYQFIHSVIEWENWIYGNASERKLVLESKDMILPVVKWGDYITPTGRAKPRPLLLVRQSGTEAEKIILSRPFVGVTADGTPENGLYTIFDTKLDVEPIQNSIKLFLGSLTEEQRSSCSFPIDSDEWRKWLNTETYIRAGISLRDLNETQKQLAFNIIETSLSPEGLKKTQSIMKMEGYLSRLTHEFEKLGSDRYWLTFMGEPGSATGWGWQLDGHHLVINYFILGNQVVMTPTFMGSELRYIADSIDTGTKTFEREEQLALSLYQSFDDNQKELATLHDVKEYAYVQAPAYTDNAVVPYVGIRYDQLNPVQQDMLMSLISEYVGNMREGHAGIKMAEIQDHLDRLYFSWVGTASDTAPFYYRIYSPVILIEFDHQRPVFFPGNKPTRKHVHSIVRTPNGNDYGKDLLRQHLEQHHQQ